MFPHLLLMRWTIPITYLSLETSPFQFGRARIQRRLERCDWVFSVILPDETPSLPIVQSGQTCTFSPKCHIRIIRLSSESYVSSLELFPFK
jgi:hypothetical protein